MTLINASGARSFYYQICFCCLKIFRQKNLRYLVHGQAKGFVEPIAMKMNVQVKLIIAIAVIFTKGIFRRAGSVVNAMHQPLLPIVFEVSVTGNSVRRLEVKR